MDCKKMENYKGVMVKSTGNPEEQTQKYLYPQHEGGGVQFFLQKEHLLKKFISFISRYFKALVKYFFFLTNPFEAISCSCMVCSYKKNIIRQIPSIFKKLMIHSSL